MGSRGNSGNIPPKHDESELSRSVELKAIHIIKVAASELDKLITQTEGEREADVRVGDKRERQSQEAPIKKRKLASSKQATNKELEFSRLFYEELPEMRADLDVLIKKHQNLCHMIKHRIGFTEENVDQRQTLENSLIVITGQVQRSCIELSNAVQRSTALAPHSGPVGGADIDLQLSI